MSIQNAVANQVLTTTGTPAFTSVAPGNLLLSGNTIASSNANGNIIVAPNGTGVLIVNSATAAAAGFQLQVIGPIGSSGRSSVASYNSIGNYANFDGLKSASATVGTHSAIGSSESVAAFNGWGDDGTNFVRCSQILFLSNGTVSTGIVPGQIQFITANTSGTRTLAATINSSQILSLTNPLPVSSGGTNTATAGITAFNNITGYTASGSTGTTSTNLVFSTSPTFITPILGAASATSIGFTSTSGIIGTTTNNSAAAGSVGEFQQVNVVVGSAVSLTTNTAANVATLSLTAGDWDVWGNIGFDCAGTCTTMIGWISSTSATLPALSLQTRYLGFSVVAEDFVFPVTQIRISNSGTANVYLSCRGAFTGATGGFGNIYARRRR